MRRWLAAAAVVAGVAAWVVGGGERTPIGRAAPRGSGGDARREAVGSGAIATAGRRSDEGAGRAAVRWSAGGGGRRLEAPGPGIKYAMQDAARKAGVTEFFLADWDLDGALGAGDLVAFLTAFESGAAAADLNRDAVLDVRDLAEFLREYGAGRKWSTLWC